MVAEAVTLYADLQTSLRRTAAAASAHDTIPPASAHNTIPPASRLLGDHEMGALGFVTRFGSKLLHLF